jgi:cation-transporting ATPase E
MIETITGLTEAEAQDRRNRGQGNNIKLETSRSYTHIIQTNLLNPINIILFSIGAVMIAIGRVGDAVASVGIIMLNVVIGMYQEVRAKNQLDQIALLSRPRITVLRDGAEKEIDPSEIVLDDIIVVKPGDQIVVDGEIVGDGKVSVDESLLTGESDQIEKSAGDEVLSGSFCVTGSAIYTATKVGADSFANKLTADARKYVISRTPLQREINFTLRLLILLAATLGFIIILGAVVSDTPFMREVQMTAVIAGLIPNGLFLMVILAYAMGALRIVRLGALVQQSNAIESLSHVTVLCTDKTGTLTANKIVYREVYPIGIEKPELERVLGDFARSASSNNKTGEAIINGLDGAKHEVSDEVPFSSALKWSALAFDTETMRGVYVLGALEFLRDHLGDIDAAALEQIQTWSDEGLRVLAFARNSDVVLLHDSDDKPQLPALDLIGVLCFGDELRPQLRETLEGFTKGGIALKVISGDNPATVAALAKQAGFPGDLQYVSGTDLVNMDDAMFKQIAVEKTVFGRITPNQKERLVDALREQGHYVAMIGDGVNDVLSLKKANMGIAMESGSSATRSVADMILLHDSFSSLPPAFTEGQRIVNGMKDILRLFLTRVLYSALLIIGVSVIGVGFPYIPKQNTLLVLLTVGIPTLLLAVWARPGPAPRHGMLREIAHFVVPAGFSVFFFGLIVYMLAITFAVVDLVQFQITPEDIASFTEYAGITYELTTDAAFITEVSFLFAQTALTIFSLFAGLILIIFVEPPHEFFVGGDEYSGDIRPTIVAGVMLLIYFAIALIEPLRSSFEMISMSIEGYIIIGLITLIWALTLRIAWRKNWLGRFLEIDLST